MLGSLVVNEYLKLHIYQMRSSSLILGQPNTKYCVIKLCGGMAQIPLHAKLTTCPCKHGDLKTAIPSVVELDITITENVKISSNVHPAMSDSGMIDVLVIGNKVYLAFAVDQLPILKKFILEGHRKMAINIRNALISANISHGNWTDINNDKKRNNIVPQLYSPNWRCELC